MSWIGHAQEDGNPFLFVELNSGLDALIFGNTQSDFIGTSYNLDDTKSYYEGFQSGFIYGGAFGTYITQSVAFGLSANYSSYNRRQRDLGFYYDTLYTGSASDRIRLTELRLQISSLERVSSDVTVEVLAGGGVVIYNNQRTFIGNQFNETGVGWSFAAEMRLLYAPSSLLQGYASLGTVVNGFDRKVEYLVKANPNLPIPYFSNFLRFNVGVGIRYNFLSDSN